MCIRDRFILLFFTFLNLTALLINSSIILKRCNSFSGIKYKKNFLYQDTDLKKAVNVTKENRLGWIVRRKNTATLLKIGIPMFFLIFLVYYSVFLGFEKSSESIGILTTTFLSAIALYFSVEKPEPKKMTIIDIIFIWFSMGECSKFCLFILYCIRYFIRFHNWPIDTVRR